MTEKEELLALLSTKDARNLEKAMQIAKDAVIVKEDCGFVLDLRPDTLFVSSSFNLPFSMVYIDGRGFAPAPTYNQTTCRWEKWDQKSMTFGQVVWARDLDAWGREFGGLNPAAVAKKIFAMEKARHDELAGHGRRQTRGL